MQERAGSVGGQRWCRILRRRHRGEHRKRPGCGWRLCRSLAIGHLRAAPVILAQVQVRPDARALPGGAQLQQIVNGVAAFSLVVLVGAVIGGAVLWAYGAASSSYNNISNGKRMVLISALGAVIVGGAAALINFFTAMGGQI